MAQSAYRTEGRQAPLEGDGAARRLARLAVMLSPAIFAFGSLFVGRYSISVAEALTALSTLFGTHHPQLPVEVVALIVNVRLPRALAALLVGAALAASGAAFQSIFKNPLTDSGLLGINHGAGFGAALAIIALGGGVMVYPTAFLFGLAAVGLTYLVARVYRSAPTIMLILGGVVVSSVFSSLLSLLKFTADPNSELPSIVYWLMGSLGAAGYSSLWAAIPIALGCGVLVAMAWRIDILSMGDREAQTLGINVTREKLFVVSAATLATAGAICISGIVGWVGLVIPHIGRMVVGSSSRRLLPVSMALGASFVMVIDVASRSLWSSEVPLGIISALAGAPFFVYLLRKTKGGGW